MNRREVLAAALSATALAVAPPARGAPARRVRRPRRLRPGDAVRVVAPASVTLEPLELEYAGDVLRALGLEPRFGATVTARHGYLAGDDAARAADLLAAFTDPQVDAVFALRGGWGSARLLPLIDYAAIARHPKLLLGYSDITALLLALNARCGLVGIHGPNLLSDWNPHVADGVRRLLFGAERLEYRPYRPPTDSLASRAGRAQMLVPGRARGRLLGGNLTVLASLVGTPYLPDFRGALLFLEDVHEQVYRIDRSLMQLRLAGILGAVSGVVFGGFTDIPPQEGPGGFALWEVLQQHCAAEGKPAYLGAPFGHVGWNSPLPVGVRAEMDADAGMLRLLEAAVD